MNAAGAEFRVILGYVRERIYYSFMTYTSAIRYFPPSFRFFVFLSVITDYRLLREMATGTDIPT